MADNQEAEAFAQMGKDMKNRVRVDAVQTVTPSQRKQVRKNLNADLYNILDEGAIGNGVADDSDVFRAAFTADFERSLFIPRKQYRHTKTLTMNLYDLFIAGCDGALFDFSSLQSNQTALVITGIADKRLPYMNITQALSRLRIVGPGGQVSGSKGIVFDTADEGGTSHMLIQQLVIKGFETNIEFHNNSYLQNFLCINSYEAGTGIYCPSGMVNAHERMSFSHCTFFNSDLGMRMDNGDGDTYLSICSFDFNKVHIKSTNQLVELHGCHLEGINHIEAPVQAAGFGGHIKFFGGRIAMQYPTAQLPNLPANYFTANDGGTIHTYGTDYSSLIATSYELVGGNNAAACLLDGPTTYQYWNGTFMSSSAHNILQDGEFKAASLVDNWYLSATGTNHSRTKSIFPDGIADAEAKVSNAKPMVIGGKHLEIVKRFGAGSPVVVNLAVPVIGGQYISLDYFLSKSDATSGVVYTSFSFVSGTGIDANGMPQFGIGTAIGDLAPINLSAGPLAYSRYSLGNPRLVPHNAEFLILTFNLVNLNAGSLYVASVRANVFGAAPGYRRLPGYGSLRHDVSQNFDQAQRQQLLANLGLLGPVDYRNSVSVTIPTAGAWVSLGTPNRGSFIAIVEGTGNGAACGIYIIEKTAFNVQATFSVTALKETPDYVTGTNFVFRWSDGGGIDIGNATAGATCTVRLLNSLP